MSKIGKLTKSPLLFFRDYLDKKLKKSSAKASPKPTLTLDVSKLNPYKKINHIIHTGEGMTHGPSHLNMWIPYFLENGDDFVVLIRNAALFKWVKENYSYINVVYAKTASNIDNLLMTLPYIKAFYYLSNTGNLIHSLRYNNYQHIFLGHGDSDKAASAHKFFRVYDEIWVAGEAHIDRFRNANFKTNHINFVKVGRPNLAEIINNSHGNWKERFPNIRVLYLPTWEGVYEDNNYSSVRFSAVMLQELQDQFSVYISAKFHPVTGSRNKVYKDVDKKVTEVLTEKGADYYIASNSDNLSRLIMNANIFICDISAVVSECIAANGPIFVYIPNDKDIVKSNSNMDYKDYAYTYSTIEELLAVFQKVVIDGDDYLAEARVKARDYLLSVKETENNEFLKQLKMISEERALYVVEREQVSQ